jgi:hypothetical protein
MLQSQHLAHFLQSFICFSNEINTSGKTCKVSLNLKVNQLFKNLLRRRISLKQDLNLLWMLSLARHVIIEPRKKQKILTPIKVARVQN